MSLGGSASDVTSGVSSVTWSNSRGGSGTAIGTTSWSISNITLSSGDNVITVTARDAAGNTNTATLTVTYNPTTIITKSITVKKTLSPLTIDGNLDEYQWTNNVNESISTILKGAPNNTATFGAVYDDTYLYIGAKILDSDLINDSSNPWEDDSLEIYIDANHNHLTSYENPYDNQFIKGYNDTAIWDKFGNTANILHSWATITSGYTIEMAIPWSSLNTTPTPNLTIGFDVQQNDDDDGSNREHTLNWNSTQDSNYLSTANFGHLVLSSETIVSPPDTTPPTITITSPTSNATYTTTSSTVSLGGSASDVTSGVSSVTWSNSRGGSGTASGTTSWSISNINLSSGDNVITVTATDGANNASTDTITLTYTANDNLAPLCSITINNGDSYTNSTVVTLTLSATDDVGVTGYYLSTSSTVPSATATGWTAITSTTSYSDNVSYTLSSGDGIKTVYVWYKDAAGNVSSTASDSITLDTAVTSITIISPTSDTTYSTKSSTATLEGSASVATSGVVSVTWSNSRGGSGTASGITSWSIPSISLSHGKSNVITVTVTDGANEIATDTITVSRR